MVAGLYSRPPPSNGNDCRVLTVAVVGAGTIGASWAAIFLARGYDVAATDPAPNAESFLRRFVDNAWPTLETLGWVVKGASTQRLSFHKDVASAVQGARFVQESGPERAEAKIALLAESDELVLADVGVELAGSRVVTFEFENVPAEAASFLAARKPVLPDPKVLETTQAKSAEEWAANLPPNPIMGESPRFVIIGALVDHTAHHRGALTVYARLRGKVPPMPYGEM